MSVHLFHIDDATEYGIPEAVILYNLRFWLDHNLANKTHIHDGRVWTFNSLSAWSELFPYLSEPQIKRLLAKLEKTGILIKGNYNKNRFDKTSWYTLDLPEYRLEGAELSKGRNRPIDDSKASHRHSESVPCYRYKTHIKREEVETAEALQTLSDAENEQEESEPETFDIESLCDHVIAMMAVSNETDILFVKNKVADYADYLASRNKRITRSGSLAYAQRGYQQHLATQRRSLKLNAARDAATDASVEALQMKAQRTLKTAHNAAYRSGIDADPYAWTLEDYELINESLVDS